jgi:3-hydroxyisobutyrate dehydrogenase-like beta-hydroxyacid dehydrogenase
MPEMKIAYIGLGKMGAPMASHLVTAGHELTVFNRTESKSQAWLKQHPTQNYEKTPIKAALNCSVLILCVGNDQDVHDTLFGEHGAVKSLTAGSLVIDHTTTSAELARDMCQKLKLQNIDCVDAPVSGGEQGAINGQLTIMCGGDTKAVQKAKEITQAYCKTFSHTGDSGTGQLTKMVNQICIAGLIQGLAEGINFGMTAGLDMPSTMRTLSAGAASSWQMINRSETMLQDKYDHGFAVDHMDKDLGICLAEAEKINAELSITKLVSDKYKELQVLGHGQLDTSSLLKLLQQE